MRSDGEKDRTDYLYHKTVKGRPYLYFRMPITKDLIRLPLDQASPEFKRAYDACMAAIAAPPPSPTPPAPGNSDTKHIAFIGGTFGAAILKYQASTDYGNLKKSTRGKYQTTIGVMQDRIGILPFSGFDTDAVDIYSEQIARDFGPSVARNHIWMISILYKCCRKYPEFGLKGKVNPATDAEPRYSVKRQNPPWKDAAQEKFLQTAPAHLQDAFIVLRYTVQRGGDCTKMMLSDFDGEGLLITPEKQGTERGEPNWLPCVKPLRDLINRVIEQRGSEGPILLNAKGKQWASASDLSEAIRNHLISIGLAKVGTKTISMHGLRGSGASEVAELLMGNKAVKIVGGWKSNEMPEYYSRHAENKALGKKVGRAWEALVEDKTAAAVKAKRVGLRSVK